MHSRYQKVSVELNLLWFYWSPGIVFNRSYLQYGGSLIWWITQYWQCLLNNTEPRVSLGDSGSLPWTFVDQVTNSLVHSESAETFKPIWVASDSCTRLSYRIFLKSFYFSVCLCCQCFYMLEQGRTLKIIHQEIFRARNHQALVRLGIQG